MLNHNFVEGLEKALEDISSMPRDNEGRLSFEEVRKTIQFLIDEQYYFADLAADEVAASMVSPSSAYGSESSARNAPPAGSQGREG